LTDTERRPPQPFESMTDATLDFDIPAEIERLHAEAEWGAGQNAKTLVKYDDLRIVLTALRGGRRIPAHKTEGRISIHAVAGRLRVHVRDRVFDLPAGRLLALEQAVPHDVEALEDSAFLLTIAWPSSPV
jgi:quercetin dioxygenase-like cupin family protein